MRLQLDKKLRDHSKKFRYEFGLIVPGLNGCHPKLKNGIRDAEDLTGAEILAGTHPYYIDWMKRKGFID